MPGRGGLYASSGRLHVRSGTSARRDARTPVGESASWARSNRDGETSVLTRLPVPTAWWRLAPRRWTVAPIATDRGRARSPTAIRRRASAARSVPRRDDCVCARGAFPNSCQPGRAKSEPSASGRRGVSPGTYGRWNRRVGRWSRWWRRGRARDRGDETSLRLPSHAFPRAHIVAAPNAKMAVRRSNVLQMADSSAV